MLKIKTKKIAWKRKGKTFFSCEDMPIIGDSIVLSCQGKHFDKKMEAIIIDIKKNGWLRVRRQDGYILNIRNGKGMIYSEKKPICREKSRLVFGIIRDTLLNADDGDQHALTTGKFIRNLIDNHFV